MSKATYTPGKPAVIATKIVEVSPAVPETITLTLTRREAEALLSVCYRVGGNAEKGLRRVFSDRPDSLLAALHDAGIGKAPEDLVVGSIIFGDGGI